MAGAPLLDFNLRFLLEFALEEIVKNPDRRIREIFGNAKLPQHDNMLGDYFLGNAKKFFTETKIPVTLGFDLDPAQIPGVSITLQSSQPAQRYMADAGPMASRPIQAQEKASEVDWFSPRLIIPAPGFIQIVTDADLQGASKILPGLRFQDQSYQEFDIVQENGCTYLYPLPGGPGIEKCNPNRLRVVSPYADVQFRQEAMLFDEIALVTVYGHANRIEGYWLWAAIQQSILKYRMLMESQFGMQMTEPVASDYAKDDTFMGENIWRRFITLGCRAMWTWDGPDQADVAAFAAHVNGASSKYPTEIVPLA